MNIISGISFNKVLVNLHLQILIIVDSLTTLYMHFLFLYFCLLFLSARKQPFY
jgi:hypothetical protein